MRYATIGLVAAALAAGCGESQGPGMFAQQGGLEQTVQRPASQPPKKKRFDLSTPENAVDVLVSLYREGEDYVTPDLLTPEFYENMAEDPDRKIRRHKINSYTINVKHSEDGTGAEVIVHFVLDGSKQQRAEYSMKRQDGEWKFDDW